MEKRVSRKYAFSTETYFKVPVQRLIAGKNTGFPLFLYFPRNDHLILRHGIGHTFQEEDIEKLFRLQIENFWTPIEYQKTWLEYLKDEDLSETLRQVPEKTPITMDELAEEIMDPDRTNQEDKRDVLFRISSQMIGLLASTTSGDEAEAETAFRKCREFADAIVNVASRSHTMRSVYDELRKIGESELSHSTAVSTLSSLFAMGLGFVGNEVLTDVALGALLHDVGVIRMDPRLLIVPEEAYNDSERESFEQHISIGLEIIRRNFIEITDVVHTVIEQHHERFDGKGFPKGLSGIAINDLAQVVAVADYVDDLMTGRHDGEKRSPAEALAELSKLRDHSHEDEQRFNPDILNAIICHIENGKVVASKSSDQYTAEALRKYKDSALLKSEREAFQRSA